MLHYYRETSRREISLTRNELNFGSGTDSFAFPWPPQKTEETPRQAQRPSKHSVNEAFELMYHWVVPKPAVEGNEELPEKSIPLNHGKSHTVIPLKNIRTRSL